MSVRTRRLAAAGVLTATAIALPVAGLASTSPSGKPAPPASTNSAAAAAKSAAAGSEPSADLSAAEASKFAAAASNSAAAGSGKRVSPTVPAAVRAFARQLGVNAGAAGPALKQIVALSTNNGAADPASSAFAEVAYGLGVSPAQLAAAWDAVKQSLIGE
jgi:hypothetical protein